MLSHAHPKVISFLRECRVHTVRKNQEKSIVLRVARKSHEKSGNFAKT